MRKIKTEEFLSFSHHQTELQSLKSYEDWKKEEKIDIQFVLREINYSFGNSILHEIYEILSACLPSVHIKLSSCWEFLMNFITIIIIIHGEGKWNFNE